ncbi:hypothetical protein [Ferrovibrio sp.]|uniref:hypothetical protein n=1 Tax=Ferrovibrio sp. TaxID=1917215 RepID=UPI00391DA4DE
MEDMAGFRENRCREDYGFVIAVVMPWQGAGCFALDQLWPYSTAGNAVAATEKNRADTII